MIAKTMTGMLFLDERYGGVYRGRAVLVSGRSNSGKSVFGLQFLNQGIQLGECGLLLSARPAADVVIAAEALGMPIGAAVENGTAIVLEYNDYVPGANSEQHLSLPPDGFVQLQEIISANGVQRVILDTCLPWITCRTADQMALHVLSFVRSFDRLGTTTMLTLPKPVSPMASNLKRILDEIVPVAMTLSVQEGGERRVCTVTKYLGERTSGDEFPFMIQRSGGIVSGGPSKADRNATPNNVYPGRTVEAERGDAPRLSFALAERLVPGSHDANAIPQPSEIATAPRWAAVAKRDSAQGPARVSTVFSAAFP